jgi:hypothetical protein
LLASVNGAGILVVAIGVGGAFRDWAFGAIGYNTGRGHTRNGGTTISNRRKRYRCLYTTVCCIASSGVANILGIARNEGVTAVVLERIRSIGAR